LEAGRGEGRERREESFEMGTQAGSSTRGKKGISLPALDAALDV
jgi:hypothetical protein